jgi:hypothetical protein
MNSDKFELTENAAVEDHKAANAARHIADGIPTCCIESVELDALHAMIETEFRERIAAGTRQRAVQIMGKFDTLVADLTRWDETQALEDGASMGDSF